MTDDSTAVAPVRDEQGRLLPGHPGLPGAGRSRQPSNADKIRMLLEPQRERLIGKVLKNALDPDGHVSNRALELALSRLAPPPKQDSERVFIPGFRDAPDLKGRADAVIAAAAEGHISAEAAERLLRMLDTYGRAITLSDHEERLRAMEAGRRPAVVTIDATDATEAGSDLV